MKRYNLFINGEWTESNSGNTFTSLDPATLDVVAEVQRADETDVDKAVKSAKSAFNSTEWSDILPAERAKLLFRMAQLLRENKDEFAELETLDVGKPLSQSLLDVEVAAKYFEYYAGVADKIFGETIPVRSDVVDYTIREPYGVTAHVVPWNYPLQMASRSIAPALASGNTVVVKPAEDTPITALKLAELSLQAGFPKGVFNVVTGYGNEAGVYLTSHPEIDHITFTGSVPTGTNIMKSASENITSLTLELGGKSPHIVFEDANLQEAAQTVFKSITQNAGQTCSAGSRLIIDKNIENDFLDKLAELMENIEVGPGIEDSDMGPIVSKKQINTIQHYMEIAKEDNDEILYGGNPIEGMSSDLFFKPTIIKANSSKSRLAKEEVFGPILTVLSFDTKEEALEIANDTEYGLVTGIWTSNINKALWLAKKVKSGQVFINNYGAGGGVEMPFGGYGKSGFGREKGLEALKYYTQTKNVAIKFEG
ncbi:aldehyde dehydrogenase family protein [Lentibacillus amyloliquefaciens]|uniref:Aldehyde dehydrogenase n=1 Tax=Lentibacillus amyloliquefaciens TaxID=1472767 RepID=A0A0U4DQG1_9BACI|nr:aldehyde dehydrogenase family protein [Lentibacillus amyloliquefaciens]ALX47576.1 aldehyde dehydrogenase [Lentibacillus amyloliquefaciens]